MENHIEEPSNENNITGYFYLLGAVFGGLTGGFIQENFLGTVIGVIIGVALAGFFVGVLLNGREHDR